MNAAGDETTKRPPIPAGVEVDDNGFPLLVGFALDDRLVEAVAPVNWEEGDVQVGAAWNAENVAKFAGGDPGFSYRCLVDLSELNEQLVEELDNDGGGYDWSELRRNRSNPPPAVVRREADGNLAIMDGNHRIRFWKERGYQHAPVWVCDEMVREWHGQLLAQKDASFQEPATDKTTAVQQARALASAAVGSMAMSS
jgi:hypothetical protein